MNTVFQNLGGSYGKGILNISDEAEIVIEFNTGEQTTYPEGSIALNMSLKTDTSSGGIASGYFEGGVLSILDCDGQTLLSGSIGHVNISEVLNGKGLVVGEGSFEVTAGSLKEDFGHTIGNIVLLTFQVKPEDLVDLSNNYKGYTDITFYPVPEPATICILAFGAVILSIKKH